MTKGEVQGYVRVHATYRGRLGVEVGIFVAVDHLRRAGRLDAGQESQYFDIDDWFNAELPNPPFYSDGNSIGATTWFKTPVPRVMLEKIGILQRILSDHDVPHEISSSDAPGEIVYEDDFQVGVIPATRSDPTPLPEGVLLGPTTAGSKRHLARRSPTSGE